LNKKLSVFDQLCESNLKLAHSFCCISKVFVVPMGDPGLVKGGGWLETLCHTLQGEWDVKKSPLGQNY